MIGNSCFGFIRRGRVDEQRYVNDGYADFSRASHQRWQGCLKQLHYKTPANNGLWSSRTQVSFSLRIAARQRRLSRGQASKFRRRGSESIAPTGTGSPRLPRQDHHLNTLCYQQSQFHTYSCSLKGLNQWGALLQDISSRFFASSMARTSVKIHSDITSSFEQTTSKFVALVSNVCDGQLQLFSTVGEVRCQH